MSQSGRDLISTRNENKGDQRRLTDALEVRGDILGIRCNAVSNMSVRDPDVMWKLQHHLRPSPARRTLQNVKIQIQIDRPSLLLPSLSVSELVGSAPILLPKPVKLLQRPLYLPTNILSTYPQSRGSFTPRLVAIEKHVYELELIAV